MTLSWTFTAWLWQPQAKTWFSFSYNSRNSIAMSYLNNQGFEYLLVTLLVAGHIQKVLLSRFFQRIHNVILSLEELQACRVQLHRVLSACPSDFTILSTHKSQRPVVHTYKPRTHIFLRTWICFVFRSYSCRIFFFSASSICSFSMLNSLRQKADFRHQN